MVGFARKAAISPVGVSEEDFDGMLDAGLSEEECFEIIATVDLFKSVNTYTDLAKVEIDQL